MRILIVEDDPGIADVLEYSLKAAGYEVVKTAQGKLAVPLARKKFLGNIFAETDRLSRIESASPDPAARASLPEVAGQVAATFRARAQNIVFETCISEAPCWITEAVALEPGGKATLVVAYKTRGLDRHARHPHGDNRESELEREVRTEVRNAADRKPFSSEGLT